MRLLCVLCALGLFSGLAVAGDLIHLRNGRILKGRVVEEGESSIVVDFGGGKMTVPRSRIRLIERVATAAPKKLTTMRDEWFLVLHRERVAGWRRVVHTERPGRVTVEERTVFFRAGGGVDIDTRRVEAADGEGRPVEFLLMETYGKTTEITSGKKIRGQWTVQITRDGKTDPRDLSSMEVFGDDWVLPLPAWSRFLSSARPDESKTLRALDVRRLKLVSLVLHRDRDTTAPDRDAGGCRALRLDGKIQRTRALYRPGRGSLSVELNGPTLVARRTTRARVELARKAHAAPKPLSVKQAVRHPLQRNLRSRAKPKRMVHSRAGIALTLADDGWKSKMLATETGRVLALEKLGIFGTYEVFSYPLAKRGSSPDACFQRALAKLRLTAREVTVKRQATSCRIAGSEGRTAIFSARHRGEDLRGRLTIARMPNRYVVVVAACPNRWWKWANRDFKKISASLELTR